MDFSHFCHRGQTVKKRYSLFYSEFQYRIAVFTAYPMTKMTGMTKIRKPLFYGHFKAQNICHGLFLRLRRHDKNQ